MKREVMTALLRLREAKEEKLKGKGRKGKFSANAILRTSRSPDSLFDSKVSDDIRNFSDCNSDSMIGSLENACRV